MPRHIRTLAIAASLLSIVTLGGCIAVGGTRKSTEMQPTTGQQLVDLKRALDCGAISQCEFDTQKAQLLKR